MFKTLRGVEENNLNHSGRSHIGETMQVEGDLRSAGSLDVAGLVNGGIYVSDITVAESGSVRGSIESVNVEINGHVEGKISADIIIIGKNAVIKGDIFFKNTLKTEEGADIDDIIVQMKLTVIHDKNRVDALVAKMSEYSNTQNKVSPVDQHAKLYPHPQLAYISHNTPAPADGAQLTFWFYERMRGSYAERRRLTARTQSQKVAFDLKHPTSQKFDRIKFGKVWNAYKGRPDTVCLGGQKSFVPFNLWLTEYTSDGETDLTIFFKETVALLIIWNAVDSKNMVKKKVKRKYKSRFYNIRFCS